MLSGGNRRKRSKGEERAVGVRMLFACELCGNRIEATRLRAHVFYACPKLAERRRVVVGIAGV